MIKNPHGVGFTLPFAHQRRARLQANRGIVGDVARLPQLSGKPGQFLFLRLELPGNCQDQQVPAGTPGRLRAVEAIH